MKVKKLFKILFATSFVVALCINFSVNASKSTGGVSLAGLILQADACVENEPSPAFNIGRCNQFTQRCFYDVDDGDCDPNLSNW